jgi:peptidoglycan/LPS O-acetylase OafA/YrhL
MLRQNNFDILRFIFASTVFIVHAHVLSGSASLAILSQLLSSEIAVKSFFIISGFLIFMSYENSRNIKNYFEKRIRRIYPAYVFVVLSCIILGLIFTSYTWNIYFSIQIIKYIAANLTFLNFLQPNLPGVFENNTLQAVNGALWTLKVEFLFYLLVPLIVTASRKVGKITALTSVYILSVSYSLLMNHLAHITGAGFYLELQRQLPGQLTFFVAGATCYYYLPYLAKYSTWLVSLAVLGFLLQTWLPWNAIQPIALSISVVYFACIIPYLGNFSKYGDFSYGIYIIHFPILQLVTSYGLFDKTPWIALFSASILVMIMAFLLWHFVEKPFLRKSSHYIATNNT